MSIFYIKNVTIFFKLSELKIEMKFLIKNFINFYIIKLVCSIHLKQFNWTKYIDQNGTRLTASQSHIFSLRGIESFKNLTVIHLNNNRIFYIEPLVDLIETRLLDLSYNQINNLESLSKMINLTVLRLNFNQISNLNGLKFLVN